jgi:hypothetical protein
MAFRSISPMECREISLVVCAYGHPIAFGHNWGVKGLIARQVSFVTITWRHHTAENFYYEATFSKLNRIPGL